LRHMDSSLPLLQGSPTDSNGKVSATKTNSNEAIIVGAGLAGIAAAFELLERGCYVTVIDKSPYFPAGNSAKASIGLCAPGINLAGIEGMHLEALGKDSITDVIGDSETSEDNFMRGAVKDVEWLLQRFFDVERDTESISDFCPVASPGKKGNNCVLGSKKALIGQVLSGQAMLCLGKLSKTPLLKIIRGAEVTKLLKDGSTVTGVEYIDFDGTTCEANGAVVLATGGFGGDLGSDSVMAKHKPQFCGFTTLNTERINGSGITLAVEAGAGIDRMNEVNTYPLACSGKEVGDETSQFKFILSTLLLGGGGVILDCDGRRFCDEKSSEPQEISRLMLEKAKPPFRLVINADDLPENIQWICNFYLRMKVLTPYSPAGLAKEMGVDAALIEQVAGKRSCFAKIVMPAIYTCCGGLKVKRDSGAVLSSSWTGGEYDIPGLFAAGEVTVGPSQKVYAKTGVPLLHCITSGKVAGLGAAKYLNGGVEPSCKDLNAFLEWIPHDEEVVTDLAAERQVSTETTASRAKKSEEDLKQTTKEDLVKMLLALQEAGPAPAAAAPAPPEPPKDEGISWEEVKKHNTKDDVWVVINGDVIDATKFVANHPGGVQALMNYAGQDASEEWNTIHKPGTVERVGIGLGAVIKGKVQGGSAAPPPVATGGYVEPDSPDGYGKIPGPIGALIYLALNLLKQVACTALNTGNVVFKNERLGTIRSGLFLVLFTVLHSSDNQFTQLGKKQYNGMSYFLADTMQKVKGYQLFDMYIGLAVLLHVSVGLKRTWDLNMGYLVSSGKWNYMFTGLAILAFLINHLIDFRFGELFHEEGYVPLAPAYAPPYGVVLRWEAPFAFFWQDKGAPSDCILQLLCAPGKPIEVRDLYTVCYRIFQSPTKVLQYVGFCLALVAHLFLVWPKIVSAGSFQIPRDHQPAVTVIGKIAAVVCGTLYVSVPIRYYLGVMPPP